MPWTRVNPSRGSAVDPLMRSRLAVLLVALGCAPTEQSDAAATRRAMSEVDAIVQRGPVGKRTPAQYFAERAEHDPNGAGEFTKFGSMYDPKTLPEAWETADLTTIPRRELELWLAESRDLAHLAASAANRGHVALHVSLSRKDLDLPSRHARHHAALLTRVRVHVALDHHEHALDELRTLMQLEQAYRPWALVDWLVSVSRMLRAWRLAGELAAMGGWTREQLVALADLPTPPSRAAEACWSELMWNRGVTELDNDKDRREAAELWLEIASACEALSADKPTDWEYAEHDAKQQRLIAAYQLVIDLVLLRDTTPLVSTGAVVPPALELAEAYGLTLTPEPDGSVKISHASFGRSDPVILTAR